MMVDQCGGASGAGCCLAPACMTEQACRHLGSGECRRACVLLVVVGVCAACCVVCAACCGVCL